MLVYIVGFPVFQGFDFRAPTAPTQIDPDNRRGLFQKQLAYFFQLQKYYLTIRIVTIDEYVLYVFLWVAISLPIKVRFNNMVRFDNMFLPKLLIRFQTS
jgi:hypothetical protein